jgi:hypothetical protein
VPDLSQTLFGLAGASARKRPAGLWSTPVDGSRFDALTKSLGTQRSRRGVLGALAGAALTAVGLQNRVDARICRAVGNACAAADDCCSGNCVTESRTRKVCRCRSVGDCPPAPNACFSAGGCQSGGCAPATYNGDGTACLGGVCFNQTCCAPAVKTTTCAGACGPQTNNCGQAVDCGPCCTAAGLSCDGDGECCSGACDQGLCLAGPGANGAACDSNPDCLSQTCCGNICTDPASYATDPNNCGGCGAVCDSGACQASVCAPSCLINNGGCSPVATCVEHVGSSRTCTCLPGYVGDGVTCDDIDECLIANGGCSPDAICTNQPGTRDCACKPGFSGDGITCIAIDYCAAGGGCGAYALCFSTPGGAVCQCEPGFSGDGYTCTFIDFCADNHGGCSTNANCFNTPGGPVCQCNLGFSGDGYTCTVIDYCADNHGGCSADADCYNIPGGVVCVCKPGYGGDGHSCTPEVG